MRSTALEAYDLIFNAGSSKLEGFDKIETMEGGARWRWAIGPRQRITIHDIRTRSILRYRFRIPDPVLTLSVLINGIEQARLSISKPDTSREGEIFLESAALTDIQFIVYGLREENQRHSGDSRVLAFSVELLELITNSPRALLLEQEPCEILRKSVPKFFCSMAFSSLCLDGNVYAAPCCLSHTGIADSPEYGPRFQLGPSRPALSDAWNSEAIRSIRKQMMLGRVPDPCKSCLILEEGGVRSLRQRLNSEYLPLARSNTAFMDRDGYLNLSPQVFDLQIGNRCNLKCRMCFPSFSSGLAEEYAEIHHIHLPKEGGTNWIGNEDLIEQIAGSASELRFLRVIGGEPMMSKEYRQILEKLIEKKISSSISLVANTNLTILNKDLLRLFGKFHGATLIVSLDGFGPLNDFIRYPSHFDQIRENLDWLSLHAREFGINRIEFNTTVQVYNIFGLDRLIRFLKEEYPDFWWLPALMPLIDPAPFSVQVLHPQVKQTAEESLRNFLTEMRTKWPVEEISCGISLADLQSEVEGVISYMHARDLHHLFPEFQRIHNAFNLRRSQQLDYETHRKIHEYSSSRS